jgi:NAD(P)-dependent dehydrogenase (short-subunit alcohol dehydrogenase family)
MADRLTMQDPRTQYPQPPFPQQPQEAPGIASKMDPKPDHGETSYKGSGKLAGRKALITGGDSGIGRAAAIAYAREGADVAIVYLAAEEADAKEVVSLIEAEGRKALALPGDVKDEAFCRAAVQQTVDAFGGLDVLVVNAGRQQTRPTVADISTDDFDQTMKTNVYALHWFVQAAVPHLPAGAAIVAYTKGLAKQLIEKGIRANVVAPGPFWTVLQPSGGQPQEMVETFGSKSHFGRPGQPVEIAPVYVLLASQEGSYITGEVYGVTGGAGVA